jgi:hypothetical protein
MPNHWLLRIGDGVHFNASSSKSIWGIQSKHTCSKHFLSTVKEGDILWFVKTNTKGKLVAVATFRSTNKRVLGPLIPLTLTDAELGWDTTPGDWDIEVHYKDLYNLTHLSLLSKIKSPGVIRLYNEKCMVNLIAEYPNIVRDSTVPTSM